MANLANFSDEQRGRFIDWREGPYEVRITLATDDQPTKQIKKWSGGVPTECDATDPDARTEWHFPVYVRAPYNGEAIMAIKQGRASRDLNAFLSGLNGEPLEQVWFRCNRTGAGTKTTYQFERVNSEKLPF